VTVREARRSGQLFLAAKQERRRGKTVKLRGRRVSATEWTFKATVRPGRWQLILTGRAAAGYAKPAVMHRLIIACAVAARAPLV